MASLDPPGHHPFSVGRELKIGVDFGLLYVEEARGLNVPDLYPHTDLRNQQSAIGREDELRHAPERVFFLLPFQPADTRGVVGRPAGGAF